MEPTEEHRTEEAVVSQSPPEDSEEPVSPAPPQSPEPLSLSSERKTPPGGGSLRRAARTAVIVVGIALGVTVALAYAGIQPLATYKDMVQQSLFRLDDIPIPALSEEYPRTKRFSGAYYTSIPALSLQQSLTFKSDTVTLVDEFAGTLVYRYTATMETESEGELELVDVNSGHVSQVPLQYIAEADCLTLYIQGKDREGVTYCK